MQIHEGLNEKGDRIQAYVESLSTGSKHDPCYIGYFMCFNEQKYYEAHDVLNISG